MRLQEIEAFMSDDAFEKTQQALQELVERGELKKCGLDSNEVFHYVEVYRDNDGDTWHLAVPDHAFRGYLKRKCSD